MDKITEIKQVMERVIKAGTINVPIRTNTEVNGAIDRELIIDYSFDPNAPVLKVMENGVPVPLYTKSDETFRNFLRRIIQIGEDGVFEDGTKTSIYFKINPGDSWSKENVTKFYNEVKDNVNLKPYLKHVKEDGTVYQMMPYSDTNHIYFDISEMIGGTSDVKTVSEVLIEIHSILTSVSDNLSSITSSLNDKVNTLGETLDDINAQQDDFIKKLKETNDANTNTIGDLDGKFRNLMNDSARRIRNLDFSFSTTSNTGPIRITLNTDHNLNISSSIEELLGANVYIVTSDNEEMAILGNDLLFKGGTAQQDTASASQTEWIYNTFGAHGTSPWIKECKRISANVFEVLLDPSKHYKICNKYIDDISIVQYNSSNASSFYIKPTTTTNPMLTRTGPKMIKFTNTLTVLDKLVFANGCEFSVN